MKSYTLSNVFRRFGLATVLYLRSRSRTYSYKGLFEIGDLAFTLHNGEVRLIETVFEPQIVMYQIVIPRVRKART